MGERDRISSGVMGGVLRSMQACGLGIAVFFTSHATAAISVNPLGDSITNGVNGAGDNVGGYRHYLSLLAAGNPALDLDFIGNRSSGDGSDNQHWGVPAAQAQNDRDLSPDDVPGMLRAVHNITADPTSDLAAFNPANGKVDAMLVHAGTNSVPGPNDVSNSSGAFGTTNAVNAMKNLLLAGTPGVTAGVSGASFSPIDQAEAQGIHAQLSESSVANGQANVFVAGIVPLFEDFGLHNDALDTYNGVGNYNHQVKNLLDTNSTLNDPASTVQYHYVDMFSITVDELDLGWLASLFTSNDESALLALISPELDASIDFVDWGFGFDEMSWDEGAQGIDETSFDGVNLDLMGDMIHPTNLGYAVMANVWYNEMAAVYIPEPGSLGLVLAGSGLLLQRRRGR